MKLVDLVKENSKGHCSLKGKPVVNFRFYGLGREVRRIGERVEAMGFPHGDLEDV